MLDTKPLLLPTSFPKVSRAKLNILQVNLGYLCNLSCTHCHVNAGPTRTELMSSEDVDLLLEYLSHSGAKILDLTGGAPEMNPEFRRLVESASKLDVEIVDRCNLTILEEPGYEDLAEFLAEHRVTIVASLPCYSEKNVREQRGKGVFEASIRGLKKLNAVGYGRQSGLTLDLVYNPNGAFLPPPQDVLELDYKRILWDEFEIEFNDLLTITNMPIKRFGGVLLAKGEYHAYMDLLRDNYSSENLDTLMCRNTLSVDWQGYVYDCDFNQMLEMPIQAGSLETNIDGVESLIGTDRVKLHLQDLFSLSIEGRSVAVAEHCYGCTAGQGSSCGGALA